MISRLILVMMLVFMGSLSSAQNSKSISATIQSEKTDLSWIQKVLDNWDSVCHQDLRLDVEPLPWSIFYDSSAAWHLNADDKLLPSHTKSPYQVQFAGQSYQLLQVPHTHDLWVPGRDPIALASFPTVAMPYADNQKTFFIAPLPSLFHRLAPPDQAQYLDFLFLGLYGHELTHTRQLMFVLPQVLHIQQAYNLPESIDDNIIENTFGKNDSYKELFFEEKKHLWNAVLTNSKDTCLAELTKALTLAEQRKKQFFVRDSLGYTELDDIFLSLEGSAMWVQYQIMLKNAPRDQSAQQTLFWLLERTASWSQEEGLALFILIDKLVPDWHSLFFEKELPSPFQVLRKAMAAQYKK